MAKIRSNEILDKALPTDKAVVPRFDIEDAQGSVLAANVTLTLKNPVIQQGMPVDKQAMDECLAASGAVTGTKKALVLAQENFVLFDGAPVSIKLFDKLSGGVTLDINGTGAKRIKTSENEDPDVGGTGVWVSLIYSAQRDVYILAASGGSSGSSAAMSSGFNLLEEVENMKYCKIIATDMGKADYGTQWANQGIMAGFCETPNYYWYARICVDSAQLEFLQLNKTTQERKYTSLALKNNTILFPTYASNYTNSSFSPQYRNDIQKIQLVPVRNSDHILFIAVASYYYTLQDGSNINQSYGRRLFAEGLVVADMRVKVNTNLADTGNNNQMGIVQLGISNALYDAASDTIFYTGRKKNITSFGNGAELAPSVLYACKVATLEDTWTFAGTLANNTTTGRAIWIVSSTEAYGFNCCNLNSGSTANGTSKAVAWKITFSATQAPSTETAIGSNKNYTAAETSWNYFSAYMYGWYVAEDNSEIGLIQSGPVKQPGNSASDSNYVHVWLFRLKLSETPELSLEVPLTLPLISNYPYGYKVSCLPGYTNKPCVAITAISYNQQAANQYSGMGYTDQRNNTVNTNVERRRMSCRVVQLDGTIGRAVTMPNIFTPGLISIQIPQYTSGNSSVVSGIYARDYYDTDNISPKTTGYCTGERAAVLTAGGLQHVNIYKGIEVSCEEDGLYKFIIVGGGAQGDVHYAGGAGYLNVTTKALAAGEKLYINIGTCSLVREPNNWGSVYMVACGATRYFNENATSILFEDGDVQLALGASGNKGGANGGTTELSGGAGGYDLVTYGGNGMNYIPASSAGGGGWPSTSNTIWNMPPQMRNGGTSANSGGVSSGVGYGAGGCAGQSSYSGDFGKTGCVIMIR